MKKARRRKRTPPKPSKRSQVKALNRMRGVLGSAILNAGREKYGEQKISDLAKVLARDLDKKKQQQIRKERRRREGLPLSQLDKNRYKVLQEIHYRKGPEVKFYKRKDGKYDRWKNGRKEKTVTASQKQAYDAARPYRKLVNLVSKTFDIKGNEARKIIKDVADQSRRKLKAFKQTKKYKQMSARRKRRYSADKTRINALMRLVFVLTGRYDPIGFRLAEGKK